MFRLSTTYPEEGSLAPDFTLNSEKGNALTLHSLQGKNIVLFFYPKDDTPGCTKEACSFRDNFDKFQTNNTFILGVSLDDDVSHKKFIDKYDLPFELLCDTAASVSKLYGVYQKKNLYGNISWGIVRTTIIIDENSRIKKVFPRVKVDNHTEEVLQEL